MTESIFIAGTGTDIGKTYIAGLILKSLIKSGVNAAYYKAAMSGNTRDDEGRLIPGDAVHVKRVSGTNQEVSSMCPYVYEKSYSPHLASELEGNPVVLDRVIDGFMALKSEYDCVIMEGSGGILCPLGRGLWLEDVIKACELPCVLAADAGLGTINAVGLTVSYMKAKGLALRGIIFNHFQPGNILHEDNLKICEAITGSKVIACVKEGDEEISCSGIHMPR